MRRFFESIRSLIRWFPVIWKDRDFDYAFLYMILRAKIRHMRIRNEKIQFYVGHEIDAKWMRVCERLLDNLIDSVYWKDDTNNGEVADMKDRKAKRLLFKIIEWRIGYWWD